MMFTDGGMNVMVERTPLEDASIDYEYKPLDKERQIRLVQIQPSLEDDDPIKLVVRHVDFVPDDIAIYTALSYVWGRPAPTYRVYISNQDSHHSGGWLSVRHGLYDFLCIQRKMDGPSLSFWIDQICINQADEEEKGHQVNQMAQIYTRAVSTLVWLGAEFEGSDEAMELILRLGKLTVSECLRELELRRLEILFHEETLSRIIDNRYCTRL